MEREEPHIYRSSTKGQSLGLDLFIPVISFILHNSSFYYLVYRWEPERFYNLAELTQLKSDGARIQT